MAWTPSTSAARCRWRRSTTSSVRRSAAITWTWTFTSRGRTRTWCASSFRSSPRRSSRGRQPRGGRSTSRGRTRISRLTRRQSADRAGRVIGGVSAASPLSDPAEDELGQVPPGRARWMLFAALLAVFVGSLDLTVIATLLPKIVSDLQINTSDIDRYVWVVSGYLLAYMVTIPVLGRVSDLIGRRPVFVAALVIFVVGSLLSARAGGLGALIVGRAIQGFGGGALVPVTMALVGDVLPARRRAAVIGLVGAIDTMGWVLGPLYGAALLGLTGSWRIVFWINIPIAALTMVILLFTWRGVPSERRREPL